MTKRVQLVRHDNAGSSTFQGKLGEITVNTGNKSLHVHDGINEGGSELARADLVNVAVATAANVGKMSAQQAAELAQALLDIVTNAGDISTNAADIATNLANITTNIANILANTTKLATIETGAQVTSTAHVTTAGALMDSEVDADLKTFSLPANTTISAFIKTLLDDTTAALARTTLGLGSLAILNQVPNSSIGTTQLASGAVQRVKLQTAIVSASGGLSGGASIEISLGAYSFYPQLASTEAGGSRIEAILSVTNTSADTPKIVLLNAEKSQSRSYNLDYRYINI